MKITKAKLKQIIKEEISNIMEAEMTIGEEIREFIEYAKKKFPLASLEIAKRQAGKVLDEMSWVHANIVIPATGDDSIGVLGRSKMKELSEHMTAMIADLREAIDPEFTDATFDEEY